MAEGMLRRTGYALALAGGLGGVLGALPAQAVGPASIADLAEPLLAAVVTISTSQVVTAARTAAPTTQTGSGDR